MKEFGVRLQLDRDGDQYQPGDTLSGSFTLGLDGWPAPEAVELSVLFHTEGKGDTHRDVHYFRRWENEQSGKFDPHVIHEFSTVLPKTPLSYEGWIVKLYWEVVVRVCFAGGKSLVATAPFFLGNVAPIKAAGS